MYPKQECQWIRDYVGKMEELELVRRVKPGVDPDPEFVSQVVLVKNGQTQQDYRFCGNFVQLN